MPTQLMTSPVPTQNDEREVIRRTANFHPSVWGDLFLNCSSDDENTHASLKQKVEELKVVLKRVLTAATGKLPEKLNFIDELQRLGVAYHFEKEIEEVLQHIYKNYNYNCATDDADNDLYNVALLFRLLRQQGFTVSCDIFKKFQDEKGNFKESLKSDVQGMLSLYEAGHLSVHGEDILDEAIIFTKAHLTSIETHLTYPLAAQVSYAMKQPLHKGLPRAEARRFISIYEDQDSHNETILKLAKLDYNLVQLLHKKELSEITRWWKELDFATKLSFARDRVVELYFWIVGVYFEPEFSLARKILTKVIALTSIIDDIYDVYGTLEELELFTDAIDRWDMDSMEQLPDYLKLCYQALLDVYNEIEEEMAKEGRSYRVYYAKEEMKTLVRAYFDEAKWFFEKYTPTMDEYMRVAMVTSGYSMLTTVSFVGMGDVATKKAFDWVLGGPQIITASTIIGRLMDDMTSHKFEQKRGHSASAVECYMKQYGVSEEYVHEEFNKQVANAWKDINQECLRPTAVPMPLLTRVLNLSRAIDVIYKGEDGYTHVGKRMKSCIASLLIDPVQV